MSSEGPAFVGGQERLGIYSVEKGHFEVSRVAEGEACLEVLASSRFLMTKTREAKEQYQIAHASEVQKSRSSGNSFQPSTSKNNKKKSRNAVFQIPCLTFDSVDFEEIC